MQISLQNHAMVFNLDDQMKEVDFIENLDQFIAPGKFVNTGFILPSIETNEYGNFYFKSEGRQAWTLFRTFSEIDLAELSHIRAAISRSIKLPSIHPQTIVSSFEGHTIFSIFQEQINVYEQILEQMQGMDLSKEDSQKNLNEEPKENSYLRRLYRVLATPTADWKCKESDASTHLR